MGGANSTAREYQSNAPVKQVIGNYSKVIGQKEERTYTNRNAVRIIVINAIGHMAVLEDKDKSYYSLPNGIVAYDADHQNAGEESVKEQLGCEVVVYEECIAAAEEWRGDLHQQSFCYVARMMEDKEKTELLSVEGRDGLQIMWVEVNEAIGMMKKSKPTSELGKSVRERDLFFVKEYDRLLWSGGLRAMYDDWFKV